MSGVEYMSYNFFGKQLKLKIHNAKSPHTLAVVTCKNMAFISISNLKTGEIPFQYILPQ